jgi:hypothetical protein
LPKIICHVYKTYRIFDKHISKYIPYIDTNGVIFPPNAKFRPIWPHCVKASCYISRVFTDARARARLPTKWARARANDSDGEEKKARTKSFELVGPPF